MSFDDEVELLRRRGHEVIVYERNNRELSNLGSLTMLRKLFWNHDTYNDVKKLIATHRPDVMHCTNTFPLMSTSVYDAAQEAGVPVVQSFRNYRLFCANSVCALKGKPCLKCLKKRFAWAAVKNRCYRNNRLMTFAVACLQAYLRFKNPWKHKVALTYTLSQFSREKLIDAGVPAKKIVVKPNFVHEPLAAGSGEGDYAVFAGRLSHEKGIQTLLDAWEQLDIPLKLVIFGDGPLRQPVIDLADRDERVIWKGRCSKDEVFASIGDAKFLVFPSISYETFGRTIIEAYSMNTPVVGSNSGAVAENIIEGETGYRFETGDAKELAKVVKKICADSERLAAMRTNCGQRYRDFYTEEQNYLQLINIYNQALGTQGSTVEESLPQDEIPTAAKSLNVT